MQRRARELGVPRVKVHGIYLTLDGHAAASSEFRAISWLQIAYMLDEFSAMSKADRVSLFASHYARTLRRMVSEFTELNEIEH